MAYTPFRPNKTFWRNEYRVFLKDKDDNYLRMWILRHRENPSYRQEVIWDRPDFSWDGVIPLYMAIAIMRAELIQRGDQEAR